MLVVRVERAGKVPTFNPRTGVRGNEYEYDVVIRRNGPKGQIVTTVKRGRTLSAAKEIAAKVRAELRQRKEVF